MLLTNRKDTAELLGGMHLSQPQIPRRSDKFICHTDMLAQTTSDKPYKKIIFSSFSQNTENLALRLGITTVERQQVVEIS